MSRKKEYLIVDGYNMIFSWRSLKKIAASSLEDARVKLLEILSNYQGLRQNEIIVVFDAHQIQGGTGSVQKHGNLSVVYTKEAETADNYIERTTRGLARKQTTRVRVATSDTLEQIIILGHGATRISAADFYAEIEAQTRQMREQYTENRPVKKNMLIDNLDPKTAELLERMRLGKD